VFLCPARRSVSVLLVLTSHARTPVIKRALIDKVLARYSGEHTVYRELLQNSDDAGATEVQLRFRTAPGDDDRDPLTVHEHDLPDLKTRKITNITVRNDGEIFSERDWGRLKKIAEVSARVRQPPMWPATAHHS
jgi:hypothetical protein